MLTAVLVSPIFNLGLTACAVGWLMYAGEPKRGVLRDPRWSYVAWAFVAILTAAMGTALGYGYFEMKVRQAIAARPLEMKARILDTKSQQCLKDGLPALRVEGVKEIAVGAINGDRESMHYATFFLNVLDQIGLADDAINAKGSQGDRFASSLNSNDPTMHGVYIAVPDKNSLTEKDKHLNTILGQCGIASEFVSMDRTLNKQWIVIDQPP